MSRYESGHMPEKLSDKMNMLVAIPAWGLVCILAGGIFVAGVTINKLDALIENYNKTETKVSVIQERQITGLAKLAEHTGQISDLHTRVSGLERERRK